MEYPIFNDFIFHDTMPQNIVEQYKGIVPDEIIEIWQQYGLGSFKNGFLKIINPEEYNAILTVAYSGSDAAVPLFATGMGDIITWENNHTFILVNFGKKILNGLAQKVSSLFLSLNEDWFCEDSLFWKHYPEAIEMYGSLAYDECLGYVPLLGLGGFERVKNLQKVKIKEQLLVITALLGQFA
ncbi:MAG: DUF1851 domain-containing protein [Gracilibacteraceae bacterium]|jgi:hypothetical protein|nr:DUF1851 domain-containing protein [Gracilibacteraceae bacterium]